VAGFCVIGFRRANGAKGQTERAHGVIDLGTSRYKCSSNQHDAITSERAQSASPLFEFRLLSGGNGKKRLNKRSKVPHAIIIYD
jgi:hypothetical protein